MTKWLVDNYPQVADIPNANGDLPVHFAAAQGEIVLEWYVEDFSTVVMF